MLVLLDHKMTEIVKNLAEHVQQLKMIVISQVNRYHIMNLK